MARPALTERVALADLATEVGPAAPTMCEGWDVADLLAHIVLRESRPDLAGGILIPALAKRLQAAQEELAQTSFAALADTVRTGPPVWSPTRIGAVDELVNLTEFFVHHEDIRRANGMGPRPADPVLDRALAGWLKRSARMWFRRVEAGVTLAPAIGRSYVAHPATDLGSVVLTGGIEELVLYAYGRRSVAEVDVQGPPAALEALAAAQLGI